MITIRSIAASTCLRTPASKVRTLSLMRASSGMTFSLVTSPHYAHGDHRRIVCGNLAGHDGLGSRRTTDAAIRRRDRCLPAASEPCAPRPNRRICKLSAAEVIGPALPAMVPAGPTMTCWPSTTLGAGKRLSRPSSIIAWAPCVRFLHPVGRQTINVPFQASRACDSNVAAPVNHATCISWSTHMTHWHWRFRRHPLPTPCSHKQGPYSRRSATHPCQLAA